MQYAVQESDPEEEDVVNAVFEPSSPREASTSSGSSSKEGKEGKKSALKRYIDSFDQETTKQMSNIMSKEAGSLLNRQAKALWGDLEELGEELRQVRQHA
jgi:hypothetical protein